MSLSPLDLLDSGNYQTYNRAVAKELGSIYAAIMLSELVNRYNYHRNRNELFTSKKHEGLWFYYTIELCEERTLLSRKSQDTAIRILEERNLFTKATIGVPGKRHFRLNFDYITALIDGSNKFSRMSQRDKVQCPKGTKCNVPNGQTIKEPLKEPQKNNNNSTPVPPPKKTIPPKTAAVPPAAAAQTVVVFSCFNQLKIDQDLAGILSSRMSEEKANKLVKRVLAWSSRSSDSIACNTILNSWDSWADVESKEDVEAKNKGWTDLNFKEGERRGCYTVSISPRYLEMIQAGAGYGNKTFEYNNKDFQDEVKSFINKNNLKKGV